MKLSVSEWVSDTFWFQCYNDYNNYNDYNGYSDYNDYNGYNDYSDYSDHNDYRDSDLNLDLVWERFSELVT